MADLEFSTEELAAEEWRPIADFEELYSVSSLGRVRRDAAPRGRARVGKILRPRANTRGYVSVSLYDGPRVVRRYIHRLAAAAFLRPAMPGEEVNHRDGRKANNRAGNLEWLTHKANTEHASATGLLVSGERHFSRARPEQVLRGERNGAAKLTDDQAAAILRRARAGESLAGLAREYGINPEVARGIFHRTRWKHLDA